MTTGTDEAVEELLALRAQREQLHRELVRKAFRIGELEQQIGEVASTYEESLSWRVTRPLRAIRGLLGGRS